MGLLKSAAVVLFGVFLTAVTFVTGSPQSTSTISAVSQQAAPAELSPVDYSMYDAEMQKALRWLDGLGQALSLSAVRQGVGLSRDMAT